VEAKWPHFYWAPDQAVQVRVLTRDIVLCSWASHFAVTVPLSTQGYKWVLATFNTGGNPVMGWNATQRGVEILLVVSCYQNQDKLLPDGLLGSYAG